MRAWIETAGLVLLVALIGALDYWSGSEIALTIFYLVPIALGAWYVGPRTGHVLAVLSAAAWLLADLYGGHAYGSPVIPPWNAAVSLGLFLLASAALSSRKRSERRLHELTSMVSHELRTPLTCIKEGIDIVSDGSSGALNEGQRAHLATAKRNADRLVRLVDKVLTFERLEARGMELCIEAVDVNRLAREAAEEFALPARRKGLALELQLAPGLPPVACDPDRISQVLDNLLGNALKFSEHGSICIRTERRPGGVRVAVEDQGPGIPEEDLEKVFRRFTQLARPGRRRAEGAGLGLSIAQQIVELHGGRIGVDTRPGSGSSFHFSLPARAG